MTRDGLESESQPAQGVDQKKLIALFQSGALEDVMSNQVQGEKKLAKAVQKCVYPFFA